jgi:hypothetical protein
MSTKPRGLIEDQRSLASPVPADTPKGMRELLFAGLLAKLEAAAEREHPAFDEREHQLNDDGSSRSGSKYWQAWYRATGISSVLYLVRSELATHEEYLVAERQRINGSWSEQELECARHRDVCPRCTETSQRASAADREAEKAEQVAETYLSGIVQLRLAIARAAENGDQVTVAQIDKALSRLLNTARRKGGA